MEEAAMVFHGLDPMLRVDFQALEDGSYVLWDQASLSLADLPPGPVGEFEPAFLLDVALQR